MIAVDDVLWFCDRAIEGMAGIVVGLGDELANRTHARSGAALRRQPPAAFQGPDRPLDQGAVLVHVMEELVQHHGQMEILRDVLLRDAGRP